MDSDGHIPRGSAAPGTSAIGGLLARLAYLRKIFRNAFDGQGRSHVAASAVGLCHARLQASLADGHFYSIGKPPRTMNDSIRTSIATMRRYVERTYNLPPDEREIAEAFFARADEKNAAGGLTQDALDLFFVDMLLRHRFAHYARRPTPITYFTIHKPLKQLQT